MSLFFFPMHLSFSFSFNSMTPLFNSNIFRQCDTFHFQPAEKYRHKSCSCDYFQCCEHEQRVSCLPPCSWNNEHHSTSVVSEKLKKEDESWGEEESSLWHLLLLWGHFAFGQNETKFFLNQCPIYNVIWIWKNDFLKYLEKIIQKQQV